MHATLSRRAALAGAAVLGLAPRARAQSAVRLIVPFPPAGAIDVIARLLAARLAEAEGRAWVVDNRSGANGNIGVEAVVRAAPDGQTLLMATSATHVINPHLYRRMPFDPLRETTPIAQVATAPNLLVVHPSLGVNSLAELVALARADPGRIDYASGGSGSTGHLATEMLKAAAGIDMTHVPFRGGPAAVIDVLAGRVKVLFFTPPSLMPHVREGRLRALAISSPQRSAVAPEVPTVAESGYPGFEAVAWFGVFGPPALPRALVDEVAARIRGIVQSPDMRARLIERGTEPAFLGPDAFAAALPADSARWAEAVRVSGAQAE